MMMKPRRRPGFDLWQLKSHPIFGALCGVFRGVLKYSTPTGSRGWARVGLGVPTVVFVVFIWPVGRLPRVYTANTQTLSTAGSCLSTAQSRSSHFVFIMIYAASGGVVVRRAAHLEVGALRRFFQFLFPGSFLSSLLLLHFLFDVLRVAADPIPARRKCGQSEEK